MLVFWFWSRKIHFLQLSRVHRPSGSRKLVSVETSSFTRRQQSSSLRAGGKLWTTFGSSSARLVDMAEKQLLELVPGFQHDRKEDWEIYLSTEDAAWISNNRETYLALREDLESIENELNVRLRSKKMDKAEKLATRREFNAKKKECQAEMEEFSLSILSKIGELKALAIENRSRRVLEESEALRKRQRVDGDAGRMSFSFTSPADSMDVDPEPDNYMPSWTPQPPARPHTRDSPQSAESPPSQESPSTDPLLEGLDEEEAKLVSDLRHVICIYDCRERVLRAFRSCKAKDKSLKAIDTFHKSLAMFRTLK